MDKDTRKLVRQAKDLGWFLDDRVGGHNQRWLCCPGGCRFPVYSTPKGNQRLHVAKALRDCVHGYELKR